MDKFGFLYTKPIHIGIWIIYALLIASVIVMLIKHRNTITSRHLTGFLGCLALLHEYCVDNSVFFRSH